MPNTIIENRLAGIQTILRGVHQSSSLMSDSTKGYERQMFIDLFLKEVLPISYRFGSGDVTDASGAKSGQLDVVIEYPFSPSLPSFGCASSRLYLAETAAAVIEVKSDVSAQWEEALGTAQALAAIRRSAPLAHSHVKLPKNGPPGGPPCERIPLFVVGYTGWKKPETLMKKLEEAPDVEGILVLDPARFVSKHYSAEGPWALWALICYIHALVNSLQTAATYPWAYAR